MTDELQLTLVLAGGLTVLVGGAGALWKIYTGIRTLDTRLGTIGALLVALGPDRTVGEFVQQHDRQLRRLTTHEQAIDNMTRRLDHHGELLDELVTNTAAMRAAVERVASRLDSLEVWARSNDPTIPGGTQ